MNDRERFVACMLGEPVDRPPFYLYFEPWASTIQHWCEESSPDEVGDGRSCFEPEFPPLPLPVNCGPCPAFEREVIEEDNDTIVYVNPWGITCRDFKNKESMPEFLDFPVKSRADWERYKEERLDPDHPNRMDGDWADIGQGWHDCGLTVQLGYYPDTGLYGGVRWLLGDEECLLAFCTMPDLIHDIMDHLTTLWLHVYSKVVEQVPIDMIHFWEDMCGRNGPLIGPDHWREFMAPHYRRICAFAKEHDIPLVSVDTDGDPGLIISPMLETGVNMIFPLEVAAGSDINAYQEKYPGLACMGGIDKRVLTAGRAAIDAELARIKPAVERGRYIPELDHTVPDNVSWPDYCYYVESLKKLVGRA